mmetsp:Transcript_26218/g.61610  ORF Transcript_26218/g.61610 Transcript_26218/m.61610 type:complete len:259 (+) Transcript_26218:145-921(+)
MQNAGGDRLRHHRARGLLDLLPANVHGLSPDGIGPEARRIHLDGLHAHGRSLSNVPKRAGTDLPGALEPVLAVGLRRPEHHRVPLPQRLRLLQQRPVLQAAADHVDWRNQPSQVRCGLSVPKGTGESRRGLRAALSENHRNRHRVLQRGRSRPGRHHAAQELRPGIGHRSLRRRRRQKRRRRRRIRHRRRHFPHRRGRRGRRRGGQRRRDRRRRAAQHLRSRAAGGVRRARSRLRRGQQVQDPDGRKLHRRLEGGLQQ